jgi:FAD/FMN-containing dehydrogenase/Fe-S oxidoreductase
MHDFTRQQHELLSQALRQHIRGEVHFDPTTRRLYSTDASIYQIMPLGVVLPRTTEDLVTAVQIATELRVPITPRGGGTSLSGQAIGPGIVIDCSKYLNHILDLDISSRRVRVQPGVVLDQLNRALAAHGLQFGPDVSTASRANLGGMIGNNSAGSRSIVYGKTEDHVRALSVVLSDGSRIEATRLAAGEWDRKCEARTLEGAIYRQLRQIVTRDAAEIEARFPKILRRVSGYNLEGVLRKPGLLPVLVGSEGTLAVVAEAELDLVPRPKARGLLVPHFSHLDAALHALAICLELNPSAVELMDAMLIELAASQRELRQTMAAIVGKPAALLMVEFSGNDSAEVSYRVHELQRRLTGLPGLTAAVPALDPALRDPLWNLRRSAVPLLYGMPGDRKPVTFVEDTAVAPARLPEFASRFREILHRHGTDGAFYGHASVGCLHIRPVLNLKDPNDLVRMRRITEEVSDLVLAFGGSLSGEHGDGLARSEWNRKMFGPVVYEAFRQLKRAFDPHNLFNPGRVVDAPAMTENLRYGPTYRPIELPTVFDYSQQGGFFRSIELCNGSGVCRKTQGGAMCPSYRATRDERDSTRGRANALRLAIAGDQLSESARPEQPLRQRWLHEVMDLCLSCKACKSECPSNVDMAKLKAEFQHAYYAGRPRPPAHYLAANVHRLAPLAAHVALLANRISRVPLARWLLEKTVGIDRRRSLPTFHQQHLRRWFRTRRPATPAADPSRRVILLDDCFTTFTEPRIGQAAVTVLERAGFTVELAGIECCGRPALSKGFLTQVQRLARHGVHRLAPRLTEGVPILGLEPSCIAALADEWPELISSAAARRVAAAAVPVDVWLAEQLRSGRASLHLTRPPQRHLLHVHCHQRALWGTNGATALLRAVPGIDLTTLDVGCCGMAGSFGYEREHYELSVQIAELQLLPALRAEPDARLIAAGTSCRHQVADLAQRQALHPMELLAALSTPPDHEAASANGLASAVLSRDS